MHKSIKYLILFLIVSINCVFGSIIPHIDTLTDDKEFVIENETQTQFPQYLIAETPPILPNYNFPVLNYYPGPQFNVVPETTPEVKDLVQPEPRTLPFLINFILLPKLIIKAVKAVAFIVSAATSIGVIAFFLSTLLCTFTPFCVIGLALPALRGAERSGRQLVETFVENVPSDKIEAAADILSNVLDKYAKIKITQSKKEIMSEIYDEVKKLM